MIPAASLEIEVPNNKRSKGAQTRGFAICLAGREVTRPDYWRLELLI